MRRLFPGLLLLSLFLFAPVLARAHGAGIAAILDTDPHNLTPGQPAAISVGLFDVYNSPIPGARVQIRVEQDAHPGLQPVDLHEVAPGTYTAEITVPGAGFAVLRVEANLPDGLWSGPLPVETGAEGTKVWDMGVELLHQDPAPASVTPEPLLNSTFFAVAVPAAVVLVLGVAAVRWRWDHRPPGRQRARRTPGARPRPPSR